MYRPEEWKKLKEAIRQRVFKNYPLSEVYVPSMNYCIEAGADAMLEALAKDFEEAGIYMIQPSGAYFWNPQKFREFWDSHLGEQE